MNINNEKEETKTCRYCGITYMIKNKYSISTHLRHCKAYKEYKNNILTKDYLIVEYVDKERSAIDIANEHRLNSATAIIKLLKKYNIHVRSVFESKKCEHAIQKLKATCIERFGAENPLSKNTPVRNKMEADILEKYGVENVFQIPEIIDKIRPKSLETKYRHGIATRPELLDDCKKYRMAVINATEKIYKKLKNEINPKNLKRAMHHYNLDHIVSIDFGFRNNIPVEIIAHPVNLRIISEHDNFSKGARSDMTIDELYRRIEQHEYCKNK